MLKVFIFFGMFFGVGGLGATGGKGSYASMEDISGFSLVNFNNSANISPICKKDSLEYFEGVKKRQLWALTMIDSMQKLPNAFMMGRRAAMGQFDECLSVVHPNFTGQHCVVEIKVKRNSTESTLRELPNSLERLKLKQFAYGVCIPSTCNSTDLKFAVESLGLNDLFMFGVKESACVTERYLKLRTKDYLALTLIGFIILLAVASTTYEVLYTYSKKTETLNKLYTSFSLLSNSKLLFEKNESFPEMKAIYGIRFMSMCWIVLGHFFRNEFIHGHYINISDLFLVVNNKLTIPITNGYPAVDSFFFLSGLLLCFVFFRNTSRKGSYDAPVALIHRYLRLTPSFAFVLLIHSTLISRLANAPFSRQTLEEVEKTCLDYWWAYLFYFQNFFQREAAKCFSAGWYLSADMQMFLLSPLILYVLLLWPKVAFRYLLVLILGSSLTSFMFSYKHELPPNRSMDLFRLKGYDWGFIEYYWFLMRMSPWLIGIATGYIICGIRANKITIHLKKIWVVLGWLTAVFVWLASLFGIAAFYPYGSEHSAFGQAFYRAFHRLGWALSLSWIVIACVTGYGGFINNFLSLDIFQPLSKLSYSAYLVHLTVQMCRSFNDSRSSNYLNYFGLLYTYSGDLILSIVLSVPITLLVEMPICNIDKIVLEKVQILPYPKPERQKV